MTEIVYVDPMLMSLDPETMEIPAGTIGVIPHRTWDELGEADASDEPSMPASTLLAAGQQLERSVYPELSRLFTNNGGFNHFILPDLTKKFIIGVNSETGEIQWGDGIIYYETLPPVEVRVRDIRQEI